MLNNEVNSGACSATVFCPKSGNIKHDEIYFVIDDVSDKI